MAEVPGEGAQMADRYVRCSFCGRSIGVRPTDGVLYKHDNRNHSGFCKGSLMPVLLEQFGREGRADHG